MIIEPLYFKTRNDFRDWLTENCSTSKGVWLGFGKTKEIETLKATEALEEALCFGWIDGMIKRIDDKTYMKYFSQRRKNSKWSQKNRTLVTGLEKKGLMTDFGRAKIKEAKENGQWQNASKPSTITDKQIEILIELLKENKCAYDNFQSMSLSVKKTYTRAYLDAKTETGRTKRLTWIIERLEKNLKPM
ncbi:YdeI/OmpD-associated family protein [Thomasclavelia sp.]